MHIVYVSDAKAGHRSQALGLYQAMHQQNPNTSFEEIRLEQLPLLVILKGLLSHQVNGIMQQPDFIFGVGSHTHLRVWLLGKVYPKAKTVILMKPSLPIQCFDYAVIPEHDGIAASDHVIVTQGALNPIKNEHRHQENRILIALGGNSKRHQWNENKVLMAIAQIVQQNSQCQIILTTSRRTPEHFLTHLKQQSYVQQLDIFPVEQTPQGWIFEQMQQAEVIYVTEDSVSMIFEALTAGCRVGVIAMDRLKSDRITQLIDQLPFEQTTEIIRLLQLTTPLHEAKRVASQLLDSSSF
ncbi:mitochondrial fission ELM1 family protein [Acinetobacter sp. S40]|uniref:mitochondrial fission ELM1 family protein n=1 Tax=unclassified Acinetobacter TaxID=196816 RepID=UPI00190B15FA|nr:MULTISPECIES: ELM1/GtrOC1 family putative glycosyltransferase [unclassified Acinetobacter]MBJ9985537.1 mitochondrial fission ELM1 family protein [Acinetobacter sp. S40]MBK0064516.1 mitochondrial fission ELM1 family protein [Acinetobacter sp. S55]MBK0067937.1 mitochondrial fission ELM1 family protein [Acinetobacter sp. S54]